MSPKTKFFFDHLPKTAGTSLDAAFIELFPSYRRANQTSNSHNLVIRQPNTDYIGGHFYFYPQENLSSAHFYCTVLRNPVDRFVSQYFFSRQVGEDLLQRGSMQDLHSTDPQVLSATKLDLLEYVNQEGPLQNTFSNVQACHFAGRIVSNPETLSEQDLIDAAIASLEGYDLIGSFENLQGFVDAISSNFAKPSVTLRHLNVTRGMSERRLIPQMALDILVDSNRADLKLLQWASQRFDWEAGSKPKLLGEVIDHAGENKTKNLTDTPLNFGDKQIQIVSAQCKGLNSGKMIVSTGEPIIVELEVEASIPEPELTIGIALRDREGHLIYGVNSQLLATPINIKRQGKYKIQIKLQNNLGVGVYTVTLALHKEHSHTSGCYHWLDSATSFEVTALGGHLFEGMVDCRAEISQTEVGAA